MFSPRHPTTNSRGTILYICDPHADELHIQRLPASLADARRNMLPYSPPGSDAMHYQTQIPQNFVDPNMPPSPSPIEASMSSFRTLATPPYDVSEKPKREKLTRSREGWSCLNFRPTLHSSFPFHRLLDLPRPPQEMHGYARRRRRLRSLPASRNRMFGILSQKARLDAGSAPVAIFSLSYI